MSYTLTTTGNILSQTNSTVSVANTTGINTLWNTPYTINSMSATDYFTVSSNPSHDTLEVKGTANIQGDLKVKGKSIVDSLERIEERLAILRPNLELEEKWDKLRGLRQAYMELEAEIKEKEQIWATLKK